MTRTSRVIRIAGAVLLLTLLFTLLGAADSLACGRGCPLTAEFWFSALAFAVVVILLLALVAIIFCAIGYLVITATED